MWFLSWNLFSKVFSHRGPELQLCVIYHERHCIQRLLAYSRGRTNLLFLSQKGAREKCDLCNLVDHVTTGDIWGAELATITLFPRGLKVSASSQFNEILRVLCNTQCVCVFCGQCLVSNSGSSDFHTRPECDEYIQIFEYSNILVTNFHECHTLLWWFSGGDEYA